MRVNPLPSPAVDWKAIQDGIHRWCCSSTGLEWVWADQKAPQPLYPYGLLNVVSGLTKVGGLDERRTRCENGRIEQIITGPRYFTISFQVQVGLPSSDNDARVFAESYLATLQASVLLESSRQILKRSNIAVVEELPIQSLDLVIATETVSRAAMDIRFVTQSCLVEEIPAIDVVRIESGKFPPSDQSVDGTEFDIGG